MQNGSWLILIVGLPGTGKSFLARRLADLFKASIVTTEVIRSQLLGDAVVDEDKDFTHDELVLTYRVVNLIVDALLSGGQSVIVDGVFRSEEQRKSVFAIAKRHGVSVLGIQTVCSDTSALERLRHRKELGTVSPAGEITYAKLKDLFEPVGSEFIYVHTDAPV